MRNPKDFFRPLAVGAPEPAPGDPVPAVADDPLLPAVEPEDGGQGPRHRADRRHPPRQPRGRRAGRRQGGRPRRAGRGRPGTVDFGDTQLWTRVNSLDSPWGLDDLVTAVTEVGDTLDVIMIPKVEGAEDIHYVDRLLAQLEAKAGLDPADPGARHPRDGPRRRQRRGDLRRLAPHAGPVARPGRPGRQPADEDHPGRRRPPRLPRAPGPGRRRHRGRPRRPTSRTSGTTRSPAWSTPAWPTGSSPFYGPFGDIKDTVACEDQFRNAYLLGCVGAWSLHPVQIDIAKRVFSPDPADVRPRPRGDRGHGRRHRRRHARRQDGGRRLGEAVPGDGRAGRASSPPRPRAGPAYGF